MCIKSNNKNIRRPHLTKNVQAGSQAHWGSEHHRHCYISYCNGEIHIVIANAVLIIYNCSTPNTLHGCLKYSPMYIKHHTSHDVRGQRQARQNTTKHQENIPSNIKAHIYHLANLHSYVYDKCYLCFNVLQITSHRQTFKTRKPYRKTNEQ